MISPLDGSASLRVVLSALLLTAGCIGLVQDEQSSNDRIDDTSEPPNGATEPVDESAGESAKPNGTAAEASDSDGGFSDTHAFRGNYSKEGLFASPLNPGRYEIREPVVRYIESDLDEAAIEIGIVRPDVPEHHQTPVIAVASPYHAPLEPDRMQSENATARGKARSRSSPSIHPTRCSSNPRKWTTGSVHRLPGGDVGPPGCPPA